MTGPSHPTIPFARTVVSVVTQRPRVRTKDYVTTKEIREGSSYAGHAQEEIGVLRTVPRSVCSVSCCLRLDHSICTLTSTAAETDLIFPRVRQCSDGSWCCYNLDTSDDGSRCCAAGQGTFLDSEGQVINGAVSSTSTASVARSTSSRAPVSLSTSAAPSLTGGSDSGLATGAEIGLGVGIGFGVLLLVAVGVIIWLLRRRRNNEEKSPAFEPSDWNNDARAHTLTNHSMGHKSNIHRCFRRHRVTDR